MSLRLQADDSEVAARTSDAMEASNTCKPLIRFRCNRCVRSTVLAAVGDVPGFGPLFASSWEMEPNEHRVVSDCRELKGREKRRWIADNYETKESGEPIDAPLAAGRFLRCSSCPSA